MLRVLVRGTNDIASAVAQRLFLAGDKVALVEGPQPTVTRRGMAFTDAVFDGRAELAGVVALRADDVAHLVRMFGDRVAIPLLVGDVDEILAAAWFVAVVDARMRKRAAPEVQRGLANFVIGIGPGFVAGDNVDIAIATSWDDPGGIIVTGATPALAGEQYVYAPHAGTFRTTRRIGEQVEAGEIVAQLGYTPLAVPLSGTLRGLTRDSVPVIGGTRVIEVDPRGEQAVVTGIGDHPARIADEVLSALHYH